MASDLAGPSHRHRAIYEVRHQRFRCPNSDGNCLGSSKLWDSRTRASVRASVGNGQAPGRRDGLHAIRSVLQRHGRLTQSRWSCPQQRRSRIGLHPVIYVRHAITMHGRRRWHLGIHLIGIVGVAGTFRRWTVSGPQWSRTGLWLQRA